MKNANKTTTRSSRPAERDNYTSAAAHARAGLRVLPGCPQKKRPLIANSFKDATSAPDQVWRWWRRWPSALAGIATTHFWVLDVDAKPSLTDSLAGLGAALRMPAEDLISACGLVVGTPGGGLHFYWRRTPGLSIRTTAGDIARGIDTRGHDRQARPSGYIIAPGNVLPDGRRYHVVHGSHDSLLTGELPSASRRVIYLATFSRRERAAIAADTALRAAIRDSEPAAWREILDRHQAERHPAPIALDMVGANRMRRYAAAALHAESQRLAELKDGRRTAIFHAACSLARYAAHAVLSVVEIENRLLMAWRQSGADRKHGDEYACGAIRRGLALGGNDPLPDLRAVSTRRAA